MFFGLFKLILFCGPAASRVAYIHYHSQTEHINLKNMGMFYVPAFIIGNESLSGLLLHDGEHKT